MWPSVLILQSLVTTIVFKLLRLIFISVQRIYWQLNGTAQKLREARLPDNYERSAQVLDVVLRHKFSQFQGTSVDHFLCTHNRFENPQYIIDNDNISLMTISDHDAFFCETGQKGMHLWRSEYGPFLYIAQMKFCRRLIVVPLSTFHRMAEQIGDPEGELIFLFNTARCGSTLLTQAIEYTGRCVSVSEPISPIIVAAKYRKLGDSPEMRRLARDVLRWECRPYPTMQPPPLAYFIKVDGSSGGTLPMFRTLFPASRFLFMYREIVAVGKSLYRLTLIDPLLRLVWIVGRLSGRMTTMISDTYGNLCSRVGSLDSDLTFGILMAAVATEAYLDARRRGFDIRAVRYEDLVARPLDVCRVVLEFCRLPVSLAELAVRALDVDSQRDSFIAKSKIGRFKAPELTPRTKAKLNELLKQYGVPLIGEPGILEGTLVCC